MAIPKLKMTDLSDRAAVGGNQALTVGIRGKTRVIKVPPGVLGIEIESRGRGPVIVGLKAGSPLLNLVEIHEVVLKVDEVDTVGYSAPKLGQLLNRRSDRERFLTLLQKGEAIAGEKNTLVSSPRPAGPAATRTYGKSPKASPGRIQVMPSPRPVLVEQKHSLTVSFNQQQ